MEYDFLMYMEKRVRSVSLEGCLYKCTFSTGMEKSFIAGEKGWRLAYSFILGCHLACGGRVSNRAELKKDNNNKNTF